MRVPTTLWPTAGVALLCLVAACGREEATVGKDGPRPSPNEIWDAIQPAAARYRFEPAFIYALVAAESNFDPRARNGEARGLLQIKPAAWQTVATSPYEPTVWDWRANLTAGIDYLAYLRSQLHRTAAFSYPRLLAAFHYGPEYLASRDFDLRRVPVPPNRIYAELWRGNLQPLPPPEVVKTR